MTFWTYPDDRYYYGWYDTPEGGSHPVSDAQIKATIVARLRANPHTKESALKVDVKRGVAILRGQVASRRAKRAAGDDCWDTPGVADVSNQLEVDAVSTQSLGEALVRDVMSPDVVTVQPWQSIEKAAVRMSACDIGSLVVVSGDDVVGIVTDRDLVVRGLAAGPSAPDTPIAQVVSSQPLAISPDDPIGLAVGVMRGHAVRRLPVVADGMLVGIVSLGDLARVRDPGSALAEISSATPNNEPRWGSVSPPG